MVDEPAVACDAFTLDLWAKFLDSDYAFVWRHWLLAKRWFWPVLLEVCNRKEDHYTKISNIFFFFYSSSIINFVSWALPLILIFYMSIYIYVLLYMRNQSSERYVVNKALTKNCIQNSNLAVPIASTLILDAMPSEQESKQISLNPNLTRWDYFKRGVFAYLKKCCRLRAPGRFLIIMGKLWNRKNK